MNSKIILIIQLALMGLFFYLIFGVFDAKQTSGLIGIGASMVIIFGIVLFLEKIKEKMNQQITLETPVEQTAQPTPSPQPTQTTTPPIQPTTTQPQQPSQNQSSTQIK